MGITKIKFAMLSCVGGLAMAVTANAQSTSVGYTTPTPTYQESVMYNSVPQSAGMTYFDATPATSYAQPSYAAPSSYDVSNCNGCGTGSRIGSKCGGGLRECNLGEPWRLFKQRSDEPRYNFGGWFQGGYASQANDLFLDNEDRFNLHQAWFYAEKIARPGSNGELGFGWRFDGMYGTDADDTQAFGNTQDAAGNPRGFDNTFGRGAGYGWAIPQVYAEVAAEDWSVKVGHFYTLIGYEVVTAPDNFFFSHSITLFNSEPFTHTGAIGTYNASDDLTLYGGWTLGWDTGFDQFADGSSFLGGFSTSLAENSALTYITTIGDFGARGREAYNHSIVVDTQLSDKLNWVVQSDLLRVGSTGEDNFGINQYLLYNVNDCFGVGTRVEWWKGDSLTGYAPHGGVLPATGSHSYYAATFGANWKPQANLTFRPEYRYDWSPALGYDVGYFGIDMIATY